MATIVLEQVEVDLVPFIERFRQEIGRYGRSVPKWAELTGIAKGTVENIVSPNRKGTLRVEYLNAFWKVEPTIDLHYIITGQRSNPKVFIRTEGPVDVIQE